MLRAGEEQKQRAIEMVRQGATFAAAGAAVGVSDLAVRKWCKAAGVQSARSTGGATGRAGAMVPAVVGTAPVDKENTRAATTRQRPPSPSVDVAGEVKVSAPQEALSRPAAVPDAADALETLVGPALAQRVRRLAKYNGESVAALVTRLIMTTLWQWEP